MLHSNTTLHDSRPERPLSQICDNSVDAFRVPSRRKAPIWVHRNKSDPVRRPEEAQPVTEAECTSPAASQSGIR